MSKANYEAGIIIYMLYLKTSVKNGIISLYPLNPDEMCYKCEVCGNFYGIDDLSDLSFDDHVFLKDYICPQCEAIDS